MAQSPVRRWLQTMDSWPFALNFTKVIARQFVMLGLRIAAVAVAVIIIIRAPPPHRWAFVRECSAIRDWSGDECVEYYRYCCISSECLCVFFFICEALLVRTIGEQRQWLSIVSKWWSSDQITEVLMRFSYLKSTWAKWIQNNEEKNTM